MSVRAWALIAGLLAARAGVAQELPHPLDMNLPESSFERPDPADYAVRLDNGLVAYLARADQVPLVTMSAFIRSGKVSDDRQGSAEALEAALKAGPSGLAAGAFAESLLRMTADYTVAMHDEWTEVSLNVPAEDLSEAVGLFASILQRPAIDDAAIERAGRAAGDAGADLAGESGPALYEGSLNATVDRFRGILYADHPYGRAPQKRDFDRLTPADVRDFHATFFVPGNLVLAIAGDIETDAMAADVEKHFGNWAAREVPAPELQPPVSSMKRAQHNYSADKLQTWLVFGHDLPRVPLEEQAALEVMNYILAGGHLWTRMTVETRYKYGYTNDASGFLEPHWFGPGSYTFRSYSRHDVIDDIYRNMMDEVIRIRAEPVNDEELFVAKGALTEGDFPVRYLDGYALTRTFALERLRYGNHERSASYVERISAVDAEDVLAAARKYLKPDEMQIVLMGQPVEL